MTMLSNPLNLDYFIVQGLTFTFVTAAPAVATEIQIKGSVALTLAEAVIRMAACTSLTDLGSAFNAEFVVNTAGTYLYVTCISEDPPNTPSDGNTRTLAAHTATFVVAWAFRAGIELDAGDFGVVVNFIDSGLKTFTPGSGWSSV